MIGARLLRATRMVVLAFSGAPTNIRHNQMPSISMISAPLMTEAKMPT